DAHAKLQRAEASARVLFALEKTFYLLINGRPARPSRRRIGASLDISGDALDAREQTTHPAHVAIAVATHLIGQSAQDQHPVLERFERRQDFLQLEILSLFIGPE